MLSPFLTWEVAGERKPAPDERRSDVTVAVSSSNGMLRMNNPTSFRWPEGLADRT